MSRLNWRVRSRLSSGVFADAFRYVSERTVRLALGALSGVIVARYLGPADLGLLSYVSAVFALLVPLASLGLNQVLVREFASSEDWRAVLASALLRQLPVGALVSLVGLGIVVISRWGDGSAIVLAILMAPGPVLATEQTIRAYLQAAGKVRRIVVVGLVSVAVATTVKLLGVVTGAPVWFFGAIGTIEASLVLAGLAVALPGRLSVEGLRRNYDSTYARRLVREAAPLLAAGVTVMVYMKADLLMLGAMKGDADAGLYASAARLSEVWYFIPTAAAAAVWPRLVRLHVERDSEQYQVLLQRFMSGLSALSIGAVVLVLVLADTIVRVLYGNAFAEAADVLRIHMVAAPFVFLGVAGSQWFVDRTLTGLLLRRTAAGAVVNVLANFALIPPLGPSGAALATLLAYSLSGVLLNILNERTRSLFLMQVRALTLRGPKHAGPRR